MGGLSRRALAAIGATTLAILLLGAVGALVRLLPWLLAPDVPLEVSWPFARALLAAAAEAAVLLGVPMGAAWAAATSVERGEARALHALGVGPVELTRSILPALVALAAGYVALAVAWDSGADRPGVLAGRLVDRGRASCETARTPRAASVPLVQVSWLCFPGRSSRVTGPLPGIAGRAWFSARALTPSEDLRVIALDDLHVTARTPGGKTLSLSAGLGVVRGLPPWGRSAKLAAMPRAALVAFSALAFALVVVALCLLRGLPGRARALVVGGIPGLVALASLSRVEASALPREAFLAVPVLACACSGLVDACERLIRPRIERWTAVARR